ncbi:MAG: MFS transporter [Candidatus Andeanibacterium colombiense]|uniref:MFS transporter n=1 Tax=Candidatus Andeanibacterium colombiense TaxID=3121345 RepID=A0AAJ5X8F8_9SPHN|nr:MAG: MFS transporter [Sphingomonadaceae bacterium]
MGDSTSTAADAKSVNLNDLLDQGGWGGFQKSILVLMALAYLVDGVANQSLGLAIPSLMQEWGLPREAFASIAAIGLFGLTIGAVVGGMLGDRFGRRTMMVVSTGFFGLLTIAQAWATNPHELLILRFFDGLGIGAMIPNGAAMISEFTPKRSRAVALAVGMTFIAVGGMIAGLIGNALLGPYGWEGLFVALGGIAVAVSALLLVALPESPIYLANSGASQQRLRAIAQRCGLAVGKAGITANDPRAAATHRTPISALFTGGVASSTIFLWLAFFFCLLANYSMFSWVPAMLAGLGFPPPVTGLGMTWLSFGGVVGGMGSGWLIQKFGSKIVVLTMSAGGVIAALALGTMINGGPQPLSTILGFLFVIGTFSSGLLNGLYTFSAFLYPDSARGTGVGAAAAAGRIGAIASSYAGVIALGMGGASSYFVLIAGSLAVSLAGVALIKRQIPKGG